VPVVTALPLSTQQLACDRLADLGRRPNKVLSHHAIGDRAGLATSAVLPIRGRYELACADTHYSNGRALRFPVGSGDGLHGENCADTAVPKRFEAFRAQNLDFIEVNPRQQIRGFLRVDDTQPSVE
jgi:hypothetical protein